MSSRSIRAVGWPCSRSCSSPRCWCTGRFASAARATNPSVSTRLSTPCTRRSWGIRHGRTSSSSSSTRCVPTTWVLTATRGRRRPPSIASRARTASFSSVPTALHRGRTPRSRRCSPGSTHSRFFRQRPTISRYGRRYPITTRRWRRPCERRAIERSRWWITRGSTSGSGSREGSTSFTYSSRKATLVTGRGPIPDSSSTRSQPPRRTLPKRSNRSSSICTSSIRIDRTCRRVDMRACSEAGSPRTRRVRRKA